MPFYKQTAKDESALSLANLNPVRGRKGGPAPDSAALFFSPTSASGGGPAQPQGHGQSAGKRASSYLPAGYYAAGAAQAGNGSGMTHIGGGGNSGQGYSLGGIVPHAQGYSRAPESPTRADNERRKSRAPSAFLDDLFADGDRGFDGGRI